MNGGFAYLKGIVQVVNLIDVVLSGSKAGGNGGVIYSDVSYTSTTLTPLVTIVLNS
jgi:predicted outer membrane repeat protein